MRLGAVVEDSLLETGARLLAATGVRLSFVLNVDDYNCQSCDCRGCSSNITITSMMLYARLLVNGVEAVAVASVVAFQAAHAASLSPRWPRETSRPNRSTSHEHVSHPEESGDEDERRQDRRVRGGRDGALGR